MFVIIVKIAKIGVIRLSSSKNSASTNPTADVASTLTVVYVDMYGHVQTAEVGFTVKKQ